MAGAIAALPSDLQEPYEYLDLEHLGSITLNLTSYQLGTGLIHPKELTARHVRLHMMQTGQRAAHIRHTDHHSRSGDESVRAAHRQTVSLALLGHQLEAFAGGLAAAASDSRWRCP